jgi:hypothetical protein
MTSALDAFEVIQLFSATGTDTERERENPYALGLERGLVNLHQL